MMEPKFLLCGNISPLFVMLLVKVCVILVKDFIESKSSCPSLIVFPSIWRLFSWICLILGPTCSPRSPTPDSGSSAAVVEASVEELSEECLEEGLAEAKIFLGWITRILLPSWSLVSIPKRESIRRWRTASAGREPARNQTTGSGVALWSLRRRSMCFLKWEDTRIPPLWRGPRKTFQRGGQECHKVSQLGQQQQGFLYGLLQGQLEEERRQLFCGRWTERGYWGHFHGCCG